MNPIDQIKTRNWTRSSFLWIQVRRPCGFLQKPCQPPVCLLWLPVPGTNSSKSTGIITVAFSQAWTIPGTFPSLNTKYLLQVVLRVEELKRWEWKQNTLVSYSLNPSPAHCYSYPRAGCPGNEISNPALALSVYVLPGYPAKCLFFSFPFFKFKFAMPDYVVNTSIGTTLRK